MKMRIKSGKEKVDKSTIIMMKPKARSNVNIKTRGTGMTLMVMIWATNSKIISKKSIITTQVKKSQ